MSSTLDRLTTESLNKTLCCYYNSTNQVQVVRISNIQNWYLEHVTFPNEYFLFEAPSTADLEVYQQEKSVPQLLKKLPCEQLKVEEAQVTVVH